METLITITVDRNKLLQLCDTVRQDIEDGDDVGVDEKHLAWLTECVDHVESLVS